MRHAALLLSVYTPLLLFAQAGTLDPSFSGDGLFTQDVSAYDDMVNAVAVQPDGRILGVGTVDNGDAVFSFVQRLTATGTPDPGFGTGGVRLLAVQGQQPYAYGVDLQSDGAIIVAGLLYDENLDGNAFVMRFLQDGTLDTDFGTDGLASLDFGMGPGFQSAWALEVMDDDRIVLVGEAGESGVACARLTAEGAMDDTFGESGLALTGVPFGSGLCAHVYPDGSVLAGGYRLDGDSDLLLARFDGNGVLDPDFGSGGLALLDIEGDATEFMRAVDVLPDGRIVIGGSASDEGLDDEPVVALFSADGIPDLSFGNGGLLALPFEAPQWGQVRSVVAQPDGRLLVCGFRVQPGGTENNDFFLYRLLNDGSFDPTFAGAGQVYTDVSGGTDRGLAMSLAPDGAIVVAGYGTDPDKLSAYARYLNDIGTGTGTIIPGDGTMVWPNPATERIQIRLPQHMRGHVTMSLFASDGREAQRTRLIVLDEINTLAMELPMGLGPGVYVAQVDGAAGRVRTAVTVAR